MTRTKITPASIQNQMAKTRKLTPVKVYPRSLFVTQMQQITTVHGTNHFGSKRGRGLMLWSGTMLGTIALTAYFMIVILQKFNENQIVTQINANCKVSQVPFPAVSICNFNMVSAKESANIVKILKQHRIPQKEIYSFFDSLHFLTNFGKNSRNVQNFTDIMVILKHHYFTMDSIMEEIHQKCESLLLYCTFNRKPKRCAEIFTLVKTLEGYCCAFNYVGVSDPADVSTQLPDNDFEYYDDQNEENIFSRIIMTSESGSSTGLSVVLDFEPSDYPSWSTVPYYGAKVMLSDPNDYPESSVLYRYISLGEWVEIKVEAMVFQSTSELRKVASEKRKCWFFDELVLKHTDRYSHETCTTECKMKNFMESCGCIPFKYPRDKSNRVCEFQDIKCLNNLTVHKSVNDMNCNCYKECRDKWYSISSDLAPFVGDSFPQNVTQNRSSSELAVLQVYYGKSNCNCYKKSLLIDFNYFIANFGGVFSLSFGASVLTLFEFIFIFFSASLKSIWRAITNAHNND